ncbi:MAG: mobile mystery protein A [Acidimicrobiia bacterium]
MSTAVATHLDQRLAAVRRLDLARPPRGWVRAIRDALGMTTEQLADRLEITQSAASKLEASEAAGTIRLNSLAKAADALGCTLVYALVPKESLTATLHQRARSVAAHELGAVDVTMALEDQRVGIDLATVEEYATSLLGSRRLWDRKRG